MSDELMADGGEDRAIAFWEQQATKRPNLRQYIAPEISRLRGVVPENLVVNGGFEEGTPGGTEPGQPPELPGWWLDIH